ncbi:hypothetical protein [Alkalihalobacillus sp. BA299]|uniref:hypothetical protein n=1 Tax=Alkalihalobacillus sp. BA299 TaxID=2815938 RepID=UPI001AD97800|nr:hypothetical protein [Alkalihalobacillus sp. BA299]
MNSGFALELKSHLNLDINRLEECYYQIYQYEPIDEKETIFVFTDQADIKTISKQLSRYNIVEDIHDLLFFEDAKISGRFYDYGWHGKFYYLYRDLIQPFQIIDGEEAQIQMAILQIEEDLIAYNNKERIFFVDLQFRELIEGYASAYNIGVEFL